MKAQLAHKRLTSNLISKYHSTPLHIQNETSQRPFKFRQRSIYGARNAISYDNLLEVIWKEQDTALNSIPRDEKRPLGVGTPAAYQKCRDEVTVRLKEACKPGTDDPLFHRFNAAFIKSGARGVREEIKFLFQKLAVESDKVPSAVLRDIADLSYPAEFFPGTRQMQRTIHLHVGPTNSGKTYQALKRLEEANTGFYAGPLRLLAHEVYSRLNAKGKRCALVTGEERRIPEGQRTVMSSCTVEMLPLNTRVDVAVIDEIQMLADTERGWAWTNAFLGVQAQEVHVCGEIRTVPLIQELCKITGETLEIHKYERLTPLQAMNRSLKSDFTNLKKGDAIIAFSRVALHLIKKEVEQATGRRCALVYGSLPPETRTHQSALFNDPDNDNESETSSETDSVTINTDE